MAIAKGSLSQLVFQQEATFKTLPATPDVKLLYFENESITAQRNLITTPIIRSNRNPVKPVQDNYSVTGDINTHLQAYNIGTLFKGLLGSVTTTGTGPYSHSIKVGNSIPTFFIEKGFSDIGQYLRYQGCAISGATINLTSGGYQSVTFNVIGAKYSSSTTPFDSTPTISGGYVPFYGLLYTYIYEGGVSIATIESATININNNIETKYTLGGAGEVQQIVVNGVEVTGSITCFFEDMSLINKAVNGTESMFKTKMQYGDGSGSAGNEYFEILIPELVYEVTSPVISGNNGIMATLSFRGYYDNDAVASSIQLTLKNTEATL